MVHDTWWVLGIILGLTLITFITRSAFLVLGDYIPLPEAIRRGLRYAPTCALVAIVVPDLFLQNGVFLPVWSNPKVWAGVASIVAYLLWRNMLVGILSGMVALWVLRAVLA